jgi:hypothetical protein
MGGVARVAGLAGLVLGLLLIVGVVAFFWLFANSFGDCGPPESRASSTSEMITLDAEHPFVEQRVAVHINADALPADLNPDAATLEASWSVTPSATEPSGLVPSAPDPVASELQVTFVREDTGLAEPRIGIPETTPEGQRTEFNAPRIGLDCARGQACDRAYRVILSWAHPQDGRSLSIGWSISGIVSYETRHYDRCGPPRLADVSLEAEPPVVGDANRYAHTELTPSNEQGIVVARHVNVRSDPGGVRSEPPSATAWARVNVQKAVAEDLAWRTWLRIVADDGTIVADGPLGEAYGSTVDAIVDFPILDNCGQRATCERGYWLVFQSFASAPPFASESPGNLGEFAWSMEASATSVGGQSPPAVSLSLDDGPAGEPPSEREIGPISMTLAEIETSHSVEVTFTLARPPTAADGLDPLAASVAIIHAEGHGVGVLMRVEGEGAGPLRGHANGDGRWNLIAHPFDGCQEEGPCEVAISLVAEYTGPQDYGSQEEGAEVEWSISLIGAPPDTGSVIGDVIVAPRPFGPPILLGGLIIVALVLASTAGLFMWIRHRRAQPDIE